MIGGHKLLPSAHVITLSITLLSKSDYIIAFQVLTQDNGLLNGVCKYSFGFGASRRHEGWNGKEMTIRKPSEIQR